MLETHIGHKFRVLDANINDYIELMDRRCSIILPKDLGLWHLYRTWKWASSGRSWNWCWRSNYLSE